MLNTKDISKTQQVENDFFNSENNFYSRKVFWQDGINHFRIIDDSLIDAGIQANDILGWSEDFDFSKKEGSLFVVSLSYGDMLARYVRMSEDQFMLYAANAKFPDVVVEANEMEIIGIVTKIQRDF